MCIRKFVRRLLMLNPTYRKAVSIESRLCGLEHMLTDLRVAVNQNANSVRSLQDRNLGECHEHLNNLEASLAQKTDSSVLRALGECHEHLNNAETATRGFAEAILRDDIRTRWQIVDVLDNLLYPPTMTVTCLLCGHAAPRQAYATRVSQCIFGGGRLERYVCPSCGCVFGPLKMMELDEKSLSAEYAQHYRVYCEGDSKWKEKAAFEALKPVKGGKYLNFGAGAWSKTTIDLRDAGWDVWDYEPYAPVDSRTWVIRSLSELQHHRFDGIFSNDVLEHFKDPVAALREMIGVLKPDGKMAHCTGCYEYAYEYTRFHYVFFTGKAVERLATAIGMKSLLGERLRPDEPARICLFCR